jgi:general secretion pathway protein E
MFDVSDKIGGLLVQKSLIQEADLAKALQIQANSGNRLGVALIRIGALSEDALLPVLAEQLNLTRLSGDALPDWNEWPRPIDFPCTRV